MHLRHKIDPSSFGLVEWGDTFHSANSNDYYLPFYRKGKRCMNYFHNGMLLPLHKRAGEHLVQAPLSMKHQDHSLWHLPFPSDCLKVQIADLGAKQLKQCVVYLRDEILIGGSEEMDSNHSIFYLTGKGTTLGKWRELLLLLLALFYSCCVKKLSHMTIQEVIANDEDRQVELYHNIHSNTASVNGIGFQHLPTIPANCRMKTLRYALQPLHVITLNGLQFSTPVLRNLLSIKEKRSEALFLYFSTPNAKNEHLHYLLNETSCLLIPSYMPQNQKNSWIYHGQVFSRSGHRYDFNEDVWSLPLTSCFPIIDPETSDGSIYLQERARDLGEKFNGGDDKVFEYDLIVYLPSPRNDWLHQDQCLLGYPWASNWSFFEREPDYPFPLGDNFEFATSQ